LNVGHDVGGTGGTGAVIVYSIIDAANVWLTGNPATDIYYASGKVGVGTSTPYANLTVWGGSPSNILEIVTSASTTVMSVSNTGAINAGDATSLEIPNNTNPTVDTAGQVAINTTTASSSIRYHDGTAERVVNSIYTKSTGPVASSTLAYIGSFGTTGTTSLFYMNPEHPLSVVSARCRTDQGTAHVQFSDGTNLSTVVPCSTNPVKTTISSNGAFIMGEDFKINFGSSASSPNTITVSINIQDTAD